MKITFLGTGSAINTHYFGASVLVEHTILLDTPCGINQRLLSLGIDLQSLCAVLITHAHGDHIFGLPFLLMEYMLAPRAQPLDILAPAGIEQIVQTLAGLAYPEAEPAHLLEGARACYQPITDGSTHLVEGFEVTAHRVPHGPVVTYGIRVRAADGTSFFYAPDTELTTSVFEIIRKEDTVIVDATTADVAIPGHTSLAQLVELAKQHPEKQIFATHRAGYTIDHAILPNNLTIPEPGSSFILS